MIANIENIVDHWVGVIVGSVLTIALGYWFLSLFLPIDEWISWIGRLVFRSERVEEVVVVKCHQCGHKNSEDAKFCEECGEGL